MDVVPNNNALPAFDFINDASREAAGCLILSHIYAKPQKQRCQ
jgi:hypothetical protein